MNQPESEIKENRVSKTIKTERLWPIFLNGIKTFITPAISILFSYLVIALTHKSLWGEFVPYLLFFHLGNTFSNWGSKDFLLRAFSQHPHRKIADWQSLFSTRLPVLLVVMATGFLFYEPQFTLYLSGWLLMAFISNSVTPIINDRRDYGAVIVIEMISFLLLATLCITTGKNLDISLLIQLFLVYQTTRAVLFTIRYFPFFKFKQASLNFALLLACLPFFLLAIAGFLQARFDLYIFNAFATEIELANYQIISGFLVFSQSAATIVLMPYVRNIYRMNKTARIKLSRFMLLIGIPIQLIGLTLIALVLYFFFSIELSTTQLILCFLIGYPSFTYVVHVFSAFAQTNEKQILIVSLISAGLNGLLSWFFLYLEMHTTGVLLAHACTQFVALIGYRSIKLNDYIIKENQ